ncbi:glycosyltransferase family 4 protein [Actinomycetospora sp. TBRC 11914]|uniref:glycosyltransferase family 4 protein n=1 Tax=Actinomycetospora sp. TBRC 11914 TaxID=2729387 RepID=UPI00145D1F1A|nr:glycosyltransferase family 4 protein [Actinomycetospora sp. TBRC 11914]NMO92969.1 glycosyltransferase family 4 protein [Actinomycetospora sp. TBRC 11914]
MTVLLGPQGRASRVLVVAHFAPPVHGMAVAVGRLTAAIEEVTTVRRVSVAAPSLVRSPHYHLVRVLRVLRALAVLVAERRRTATAVFTCDAGAGMVYGVALLGTARLLGYRRHLQHHSYAYLTRPSRLLGLLVRVAGPGCEHLVSCPRMRDDLRARHPGIRARVVGIAGGLTVGSPRTRPHAPLVVGFLGNVTVDKGIGTALETVDAAARAGMTVRLRVAGPVIDPEAARLLADRPEVECVGALSGPARDAFLDEVDVLLFPSRHVHESFGLAAWEAMGRGAPVIAHEAGCLTDVAVGAAGVVIAGGEDFVGPAVAALRRFAEEPASWLEASEAGRRLVGRTAAASRRDLARFATGLVGTVPDGALAH